jgi:glycosyltransferase involved in cell wall biosynthesis
MKQVLFFSEQHEGPSEWADGGAPSKDNFFDHLAGHGIAAERVVPCRAPWNPFARAHPLWRAIDPVRAFWAWLRRSRASAIISYGESGALVPILLRVLSRQKVLVIHDVDHANWRPRKMIQSFVLPRTDVVLTQTLAQKRYLKDIYRLDKEAFFAGPRIDETFFSSPAPKAGDYILAVGNDAARDYGLLMSAVAALDARVVLLTRLPVQLPPDPACRIEIIDRRVSFAELRDLYDNARLVAFPLRERMSPGGMTAILEAMAMGKPIVMTASSGAVELVADGINGVVVPLDDHDRFRDAIRGLWSDPELCLRMGAASRARLEAEYSSTRFAERLAEALASLK